MHKKRRFLKGFTLLELMIVVIIVGILASLAIPRFIDATRRAKEAEARSILGTIRSAQIRYFLENDEAYTTDITDLDISLTANPTEYYTYSAIDAGGNIGQAAAGGSGGAGASLDNFRIAEDGTITTY